MINFIEAVAGLCVNLVAKSAISFYRRQSGTDNPDYLCPPTNIFEVILPTFYSVLN